MNNKKRCKVLIQILDRLYEKYPNTGNFINTLLEETNKNENWPHKQVFSVCFGFVYCCLYYNLLHAKFHYNKPKSENDAFGYKFKTKPQIIEKK